MYKYLFLFILCITGLSSFSQERTKILLTESDNSRAVRSGGQEIIYIRNPVFQQDNAVMTCDSAVFFVTQNYFEAYRNIHINQADTINIYSQRLTYNGNTKQAHLTDNVRLLDLSSVLTTNILDYDMAAKIGTYRTGGKIVSKDVKVTSKNGYYFASSRDAYFRYNVVAITDQTTIKSDTLRYNTLTNWTYFYGPTNIKSKDDNLYTENGMYNTKTEIAAFGKKNLYTQGSKSMVGDSLYYDGKKGYGKAVKNIIYKDTVDKTVLWGQLGEYFKDAERAVVTQQAYVGLQTSDTITVDGIKKLDSLFIGADTLESVRVLKNTLTIIKPPVLNELLRQKQPPIKESGGGNDGDVPTNARNEKAESSNKIVKSVALSQDTKKAPPKVVKKEPVVKPPDLGDKRPDSSQTVAKTMKPIKSSDSAARISIDSTKLAQVDTVKSRTIKAYHNVRVFKQNLQAISDSLFYSDADSTLRWFGDPVMWTEGSQQTGDTIFVSLKNKKLHTFQVIRNAFVVNSESDSIKFNQIKGKVISGFFKDGNLHTMLVDGNAESIYYDRDSAEIVTDRNQTVSGQIKVLVKEKSITDVNAYMNVEMARQPIGEVVEDKKLTGFVWKPELRPLSKEAVTGGEKKKKGKNVEKIQPNKIKPKTAKKEKNTKIL